MHLLENIAWHSLSGPHLKFSSGTNEARRYATGFSAIMGFADLEHPRFSGLAEVCPPGEKFYCGGLAGEIPRGWRIEDQTMASQLVWNTAPPPTEDTFPAKRLGPEHLSQIMELVALTQPGPFGERTIELGEYYGAFDGDRLIAMAGERMTAGRLREISGVCTHPEFQGRGLAGRLIAKLIRLQLQRNEIPFLHVLHTNERALGLYEKMGFRHHREVLLLVVSRTE